MRVDSIWSSRGGEEKLIEGRLQDKKEMQWIEEQRTSAAALTTARPVACYFACVNTSVFFCAFFVPAFFSILQADSDCRGI